VIGSQAVQGPIVVAGVVCPPGSLAWRRRVFVYRNHRRPATYRPPQPQASPCTPTVYATAAPAAPDSGGGPSPPAAPSPPSPPSAAPDDDPDEEVQTLPFWARLLGVDVRLLHGARVRGELYCFRLGSRRWYARRRDLNRWMGVEQPDASGPDLSHPRVRAFADEVAQCVARAVLRELEGRVR
jgi:hypothetical protein